MKLDLAIEQVQEAERGLFEELVTIAERHAAESDVYHVAKRSPRGVLSSSSSCDRTQLATTPPTPRSRSQAIRRPTCSSVYAVSPRSSSANTRWRACSCSTTCAACT